MPCLLPQFKCSPDLFSVSIKSQSYVHISRSRETVNFCTQCVLTTSSPSVTATTLLDFEKRKLASYLETIPSSVSNDRSLLKPTSTANSALLDLEKLPYLDTDPIPLADDKRWAYVGAVNPASEIGDGAFNKETLLTSEEAFIAASASEALALAKAAFKVAKDAAMMVRDHKSTKSDGTTTGTLPAIEASVVNSSLLSNIEEIVSVRGSKVAENESDRQYPKLYPIADFEDVEISAEDLEFLGAQLSKSITVRSKRQTERQSRRTRAAQKVTGSISYLRSSSSSRKKRIAVQEVNYMDPLRYLRGVTSSSRLLTASEEQDLSEGIQVLLKLLRLEEELKQRLGGELTFSQWAAAAGVDQRTLRKQLNYGYQCKDKMIKSNIRLVISIAKHYQGSGMNLQDLVQERCRGLVRGAEKFDATKGFKFSTYAHWWIKQAVRKSLSDQSRTIRLPFHIVEATYRVKEARKQLYGKNGRLPNDEEIAEATGLSMKRLSAVMLTPKAPRSLDQKIGINEDLKPSDVIADPDAETCEEMLIKQFMKQDLATVLDSLNLREKQVIQLRFGLEDGRMKTLQEIGEFMGVSRERIRQIESCALHKLKNKKRTKLLHQYVIAIIHLPHPISVFETIRNHLCSLRFVARVHVRESLELVILSFHPT